MATCHKAGVVVRMLTGDNISTARAIAINCGILSINEDFIVMEGNLGRGCDYTHGCSCMVCTGPEFRRKCVRADGTINTNVLSEIAPRLRVIARCSPTDKYNLVKGLIALGMVVWHTGCDSTSVMHVCSFA